MRKTAVAAVLAIGLCGSACANDLPKDTVCDNGVVVGTGGTGPKATPPQYCPGYEPSEGDKEPKGKKDGSSEPQ